MTSKMKISTLLCLDNQEFVTEEIKQQLTDLFDNSLFKDCTATCDILPDVGVILTGRAHTRQLNNRGKAYLPQFIELVDKMGAVVLSAA